MNCYMCDRTGATTEAVAICQHCGASLCRDHLDDDLLAQKAAGFHRSGCTHALVQAAQRRQRDLRPMIASVH